MNLRWNYGANDTSDIIDVQVFAIEMVHVPQGAFSVGRASGDEAGKFYSGSSMVSYNIALENGAVTKKLIVKN